MKTATFRHGIHPGDHKDYTSARTIQKLGESEIMIFPLSQHIGAPCEALVSVGDRVYVGTKIGDCGAFVSAPIHSSVSGEVIKIEQRRTVNGTLANCVVVKNDFKNAAEPSINVPKDYEKCTPEEICALVREAGIVGMGGATFPTHVKLTVPKDKKIDCLIINGAECEPYLTSDHRVMLETPEQVVLGLKIAMRATGADKGYIAVETNKADAIKLLSSLVENEENIAVRPLKVKYPQGSEKHLIYAITHREVPSGGLPSDVGAVVLNIDTTTAIARKFLYGTPLIRRIVTLGGDAVKNPENYYVKIGTPISWIIEQNGGFAAEPRKVLAGGPMMGIPLFDLDVPVVKGTGAVLAFTSDVLCLQEQEDNCIRCGKCVSACPMNLLPLYINDYYRINNVSMCEKYNAADCIECGSCSFVCPSKRHLVQTIRLAKQEVISQKRERTRLQEAAK
ncbi:MAG: electron transport complex subunit RsxC [Clostridia bacterium]|nr:electron transport complex subunit RsxC [Clostridia bacterium]